MAVGSAPDDVDGRADPYDLQELIVRLGSAMGASGHPVYEVQARLNAVARAYGAHAARITAFPTFLMVTTGAGRPVALEVTTSPVAPRLDQVSALERVLEDAEHARMPPAEGLRRLDEIEVLKPRFGRTQSILGYGTMALGICLILHPAPRDVAAAAVFGAFVGLLRSLGSRTRLDVLLPVLAAFCVSGLCALAVKHDVTDPGLRAMVASLTVFLPGATLTTAVLELAAGQTVSGASRLVAGVMQLGLLAFGIFAGIEAVGVPTAVVFAGSEDVLGGLAPWAGVFVFAVGVLVANSAPPRSFPGLLLVLYAAWTGQVVGDAMLGAYLSAWVGALAMTPAAYYVSRLPAAMPPHASFLPGFWLLVPGALGLIGFAELAGDQASGRQDVIAAVVSIFSVAVGILCGSLLLGLVDATGRIVEDASKTIAARAPGRRRRREP